MKKTFILYVAQNMEFLAYELNFELWSAGPALCIYRYLYLDNKIRERFLALGSFFKLIFLRKRFFYGERNSKLFLLGISFALVPLRCLWHKQVSCLSTFVTDFDTSYPVHRPIFYHTGWFSRKRPQTIVYKKLCYWDNDLKIYVHILATMQNRTCS